jgi:hypothetical protein
MTEEKKLKSPRGDYRPLAIVLLAAIIFILLNLEVIWLAIESTALMVASVLFMTISIRSRNTSYLFPGLFFLVDGGMGVWEILTGTNFMTPGHPLFVTLMLLGAANIVLFFLRRFKWRRREILEMAAKSVTETKNGFTSRPLHTGTIKTSKENIQKFSNYLYKNLVVIPTLEKNRVVLTLPDQVFRRMTNLIKDPTSGSWVSFHFDGDVHVNISRKDYLKYKDELSFDQLCQSVGDLFISFFKFYNRNEEQQIIRQMNHLKLNPMFW